MLENFDKIKIYNEYNISNDEFYQNNIKKEDIAVTSKDTDDDVLWYLSIPSIDLKAPIREGIDSNTLKYYVGHFKDTSLTEGNIGLAAHNRGYENNYFERLKKIKKGDKIIYNYKNIKREYEVVKHIIIEDTDWTNLEDTEENTITLITCVENEPTYRRCVQGVEK